MLQPINTNFTFIPLTIGVQVQMLEYMSSSLVRVVTSPRRISIQMAIHSRKISEFLTFSMCKSGIKMRISQSLLHTICRN